MTSTDRDGTASTDTIEFTITDGHLGAEPDGAVRARVPVCRDTGVAFAVGSGSLGAVLVLWRWRRTRRVSQVIRTRAGRPR